MVPDQSFLSDTAIHLPESIRGALLSHCLKLINHCMVITMTLVIIHGSGEIHHFAGPTKTNLIRLPQMIYTDTFLSGP